MNITKYPQYHMYLLTLHLLMMKAQLLPKDCDERCINATIINRAYYSSYIFCELWLEDVKKFKSIAPWEFTHGERHISQHKQIRTALYNFNEVNISYKLNELFNLRIKADYDPFNDITPNEVNNAISLMEKIFSHLKFE